MHSSALPWSNTAPRSPPKHVWCAWPWSSSPCSSKGSRKPCPKYQQISTYSLYDMTFLHYICSLSKTKTNCRLETSIFRNVHIYSLVPPLYDRNFTVFNSSLFQWKIILYNRVLSLCNYQQSYRHKDKTVSTYDHYSSILFTAVKEPGSHDGSPTRSSNLMPSRHMRCFKRLCHIGVATKFAARLLSSTRERSWGSRAKAWEHYRC